MAQSIENENPDVVQMRDLAVEQHDKTADVFDAMYGQLEDGHCASAFLYGRKKIDELLADTLRSLPAQARILDVGCGTGEQIHALRQQGYECVGVEPAPHMRQYARQRNPGTEITEGTVTDIRLPDDQFDLVICLEVLRYLHPDDIAQGNKEMLRVLKPGGTLFATHVNVLALDGFYVFDRIKRLALRLFGRPLPAHCEFVTPGRVRRGLRKAGFDSVRTLGCMAGPLRIAYKVNQKLGSMVAKTLEPVDNIVCRLPGSTAWAGHLIACAVKPEHHSHPADSPDC